ncbi:MAG: hypothetical protein HC828_09075 [Blastochloris sp.]|nr:hypothetical protein [Blastochloris sp.]
MNELSIELPAAFDASHERAVIDFLTDRVSGSAAWARVFAAFDLLEAAVLVVDTEHRSFRAVYTLIVDQPLANAYLADLLALQDIRQESPALWASYARRIGQSLTERGWRRPETRLLYAYLLYWWGSFARGYALEVEIFRDLEASGVQFLAHDLRDPQARYSLSDLTGRPCRRHQDFDLLRPGSRTAGARCKNRAPDLQRDSAYARRDAPAGSVGEDQRRHNAWYHGHIARPLPYSGGHPSPRS